MSLTAFFISTSGISARDSHLNRLSAIRPVIGELIHPVKWAGRGDRHARA